MIDDTNNGGQFAEEAETNYPPPAHFDESATANARPVQPIPTGGIALWVERARYVRQAVSGKTRIVVLTVVGALALGALGGAMLVRPNASRADSEPVIESAPIEVSGATASPPPTAEIPAANAAATESTGTQSISRVGNRQARPAARRAKRAYRVAVIR